MFYNNIWYYSKRKYKGCKIYCELFIEPQGDIGLPRFILINERENKIRYNNMGEEWLEIMEKLNKSTNKLDESTDFIFLLNELEYRHCNDEERNIILDKICKSTKK